MRPVALQLYSVREYAKEDLPATLAKVAQMGYAGVEFSGFHGREPREMRKVLDDLDLRASSAHWSLATEENLQEIVDFAGLFDVSVTVSGWKPREDWDSVDGVKRIAEAFQKSAELLKPHGIIQAYHNHWWELQDLDGRRGTEVFLDQAPDAAAELDVYWACRFGEVDVPAFLRTWGSRCPLVHIKDGPLVEGEPHTAVGAGKMDIPSVVDALDEDTTQWLIVEIDRCEDDMLRACADSLEYLVANDLGRGRG